MFQTVSASWGRCDGDNSSNYVTAENVSDSVSPGGPMWRWTPPQGCAGPCRCQTLSGSGGGCDGSAPKPGSRRNSFQTVSASGGRCDWAFTCLRGCRPSFRQCQPRGADVTF